eukprot:TRINITY_DN38262_c0_g1_i1.p1 TRINITY_DN38262_c0_g1~~TRINITY_DN38262_c0_g1_i1.p1  ORF type:complete len:217 (+),score=51.19 TRINITY_DN38262_c0_g1_i1:129-779(+)
MRAALATRCPEIDEQFGDAEAFRAEMLKTMDSHPDRKHDFTFLRKATLHRLLGNETHVTEIFELWFKARNSPEFFPGALEALAALRAKNVKIGTLTDGNSDPHTMDGLRDLIDFSVNATEAGAPKPDKRMFSLCEAKSGCKASAMVMVGDNADKDVVGALNAGWKAIWVRPPQNGPAIVGSPMDLGGGGLGEASRADAAVAHVEEVEDILHSWAQT